MEGRNYFIFVVLYVTQDKMTNIQSRPLYFGRKPRGVWRANYTFPFWDEGPGGAYPGKVFVTKYQDIKI